MLNVSGLVTSESKIQLLTGKPTYVPGEKIQIIGAFNPNDLIHIDLVNPLDNMQNSTLLQSDNTGHFRTNYIVPYNAVNGTWKILATRGLSHTSLDIQVISSNYGTKNTTYTNGTGGPATPMQIKSPLKQFNFGIQSDAVQCLPDLKLLIKSENNLPVCVKSSSSTRLLAQGWKLPDETSLQNIQTQFQSKIITKENAIKIADEYVKEQNKTGIINYTDSEIQTNLVYYITTSFPRVPVDYGTGVPTKVIDWLDEYYQNPQWWTELEKNYLGLSNHRIETGHVVWELDYGTVDHYIANHPMIFVDAITGKVVDTKWLY